MTDPDAQGPASPLVPIVDDDAEARRAAMQALRDDLGDVDKPQCDPRVVSEVLDDRTAFVAEVQQHMARLRKERDT